MNAGTAATDEQVSVDIDVDEARTTISVTGSSEVAIVVRSAAGEQIYLPPEERDETGRQSPYRPVGSGDTPYAGIPDASPYESARESQSRVGRAPTANGFRIVHPEPVRDLRLLR